MGFLFVVLFDGSGGGILVSFCGVGSTRRIPG